MEIVSENMSTSLGLEAEVTNTTLPTISSFCNLKAFGVSGFRQSIDLRAEKSLNV